MSPATVWWVIAAAGCGTLLLRLSFLVLVRGAPPPLMRRILRLVPAAVLMALVAPGVLPGHGPATWSGAAAARLVAGGVAVLVARASGNMILTLLAGMGTLWLAGSIW